MIARLAMADSACPPGWHHVAAVRSGEVINVLLDGEVIGSQSGADIAEYDLSNGLPLQIGRGPNDFFNGRMADVRLFNRALTADELKRLSEN